MKKFARLAFGSLLGWATWLTTTATLNSSDYSSTFFASAASVAVGLAALLQFYDLTTRWLEAGPVAIRSIEGILQQKILAINNNGHLGKDLTLISSHVWSVPTWYRTLMPYRFRQRLKRTFADGLQNRWGTRPYLARLACFQLPTQPPLGIRFKKGYGLIGACIEQNQRTKIHYMRLDGTEFRDALKAGHEAWDNSTSLLTKHLSHSDAQRLADKYGQALAVVIQNLKSGEPIGCLTLETKRGFHDSLDCNPALNEALVSLADLLSPLVEKA